MENTITGIAVVVMIVFYILYLVRATNRDVRAQEAERQAYTMQNTSLLLPAQAQSLQEQPKQSPVARFKEAWNEAKEEMEHKTKPQLPAEKVHYVPEPEEEEWIYLPAEKEQGEEETSPELPSPTPQEEYIPIDQLEAVDKAQYYDAICEVFNQVVDYFNEHGKVTRDGLLTAGMARRDWDHTSKQGDGIFWEAEILSKDPIGNTIVNEDCAIILHEYFKSRGYNILEPEELDEGE